LVLVASTAKPSSIAEWYVAVDGSPLCQGTLESPWDIDSALRGDQKIAPGDTLLLRGGTYKKPFQPNGYGFPVRLAGSPSAPIHVRPFNRERVTLDGGLLVQDPARYLWLWDLEILVSEPLPPEPLPAGWYPTIPHGGLNIYAGEGCKYINLVVHNNLEGVSFWTPATNSELYGCLIYDNGYRATDRTWGHGIYTQNDTGLKTIADCILTGGKGYSLHAYGESAAVNNYLVEGNIAYNHEGDFLVGGLKGSRGIRVLSNYVYDDNLRVGYMATDSVDCEVRDNVVGNGELRIFGFQQVINEGNLAVKVGATRPTGARALLRPNKYDARRAHLAIFNWEKKASVNVSAGTFLKAGESYRLLDPRNFYGKAVAAGSYNGTAIPVPMSGEFAAFVLMKDTP
jgi:hypothetical protein